MNLYKVTFTFCESYAVKVETFISVSMTIRAYTSTGAAADAWAKISPIVEVVEPMSTNVEKVSNRC